MENKIVVHDKTTDTKAQFSNTEDAFEQAAFLVSLGHLVSVGPLED